MGREKDGKTQIQKEIRVQIGRKIIIFLLIAASIIGFAMTMIISKSNRTEIQLEAEIASWETSDFFQPYIAMAQNMAVSPQIQQILEENNSGMDITKHKAYEICFRQLLNLAEANSEAVATTWVVDLDADSVIMSNGYVSMGDFKAEQYEWYACAQEKKTLFSEPYKQQTDSNDAVISITSPVFDKNGKVIGIVGVDVKLSRISNIMEKYTIGENGFSILLSPKCAVAYAPTAGIILMNMKDLSVNEEAIQAVETQTPQSMKIKFGNSVEYGHFAKVGSSEYMVLSVLPASEYYQSVTIFILILVLFVAVACVLVLLGIKSSAAKISKPIVELKDIAQKLAEGSLDVDLKTSSKNEIGELAYYVGKTVERLREYIVYIDEVSAILKDMSEGNLKFQLEHEYIGEFARLSDALYGITGGLTNVMYGINDGAEQVLKGSDELSNISQSLAQGASAQATEVETLINITNKITEEVEENRVKAEKSAEETIRVTKMMEANQELMNQMMEAMLTIQTTSHEVVGIIQAIEDIASQTNLLSLNASIEAARAGEVGRGFAVVADEIGKLADESAKAANTTRELIEISISEIAKGNEMAEKVKFALSDVSQAFEQVNGMIVETADMAVEQAKDMKQIRKGVEDISQGITKNSQVADESAATSQELAMQASNLTQLIKRFKY